MVSVDSCHFPYRYDIISPTQMQEVFYSPTPIMAVPLNIRWQFPHTFCWYPSPLIQTSGHTNLINHIQYFTSYIQILSSNSFIGHVSGSKGKSSQKVRYQSSVQRRGDTKGAGHNFLHHKRTGLCICDLVCARILIRQHRKTLSFYCICTLHD